MRYALTIGSRVTRGKPTCVEIGLSWSIKAIYLGVENTDGPTQHLGHGLQHALIDAGDRPWLGTVGGHEAALAAGPRARDAGLHHVPVAWGTSSETT